MREYINRLSRGKFRYDIPDIVKEKNVNIIYLAIDNITQRSRKNIIEICKFL